MIDLLMQILLVTVLAGFPILAIAANFMRHRLEESVERNGISADAAIEDGFYPLVLPYRESSTKEAKRAA